MTRRYANNLIASTKVIENFGTIVPIQPTAESQVRPLIHLPAEQQQEVWKEALKTAPKGRVTARHVEKIVQKKVNTQAPPTEKKETENLFNLKHWWKCTSQRDRKIFLSWIEERSSKG